MVGVAVAVGVVVAVAVVVVVGVLVVVAVGVAVVVAVAVGVAVGVVMMTSSTCREGRPLRWVAQRHDWDCGVAVLAMLTGDPYEQVRIGIPLRGPLCEAPLKPDEMERYLCHRGFFLRRLQLRTEAPGGVWPPRAFAPAHFLLVKSPTREGGHWVAMDASGGVLDPFNASRNGQPSSFYGACYLAWGVAVEELAA